MPTLKNCLVTQHHGRSAPPHTQAGSNHTNKKLTIKRDKASKHQRGKSKDGGSGGFQMS